MSDQARELPGPEATALLTAVEQLLAQAGEPLPDLAGLLGENVALAVAPPGYVVAQFENPEGLSAPWGMAIAELIRVALADLPRRYLREPRIDPEVVFSECWYPGMRSSHPPETLDDLVAYGRHVGLDRGVCGKLTRDSGRLAIDIEIHALAERRCLQQQRFEAAGFEDLPEALADIVSWLAAEAGVALDSKARQLIVDRIDADQLNHYVKLFPLPLRDSDRKDTRQAASIFKSGRFLAGRILYHAYADDKLLRMPHRIMAEYEEIREQFGNHAELLAAKIWGDSDANLSVLYAEIAAFVLQALARQPDNLSLLRSAILVLYYGDQEAATVRLAIEYVRLYPKDSQAWYTLADCIEDLAWEFRGEEFWDNVGEREQDLFSELLETARAACDRCLELTPHRPDARRLRAALENGCSELLWEHYESLTDDFPDWEAGYDTAMHFAAPRWGGSLALQFEIFVKALDANGPKPWVMALYNDYIGGNQGYTIGDRLTFFFYRRLRPGWPQNIMSKLADR